MNRLAPSPTARKSGSDLKIIVQAGLVAGTLDILSACSNYFISTGKNPIGVLKFVASGAFGKDALAGGPGMAFWGLAFHFLIALTFALFFFLIYPTIRRVFTNPIATGLLYGLFVWMVMNLIVLPMSNVPARPFRWANALINMAILMVAVGLPISLIISRYFSRKQTSA